MAGQGSGDAPEPVSAQLRRLREQLGLTQRDLAVAAKVSIAAIRDLEQGRTRVPRAATLHALAHYLSAAGADDAATLRQAAPAARSRRAQPPQPAGARPLTVAALGPLILRHGGTELRLGSARHRCLLARLALAGGEVVGRDELMGLLWGEDRPPSALNLLHSYVGRLRRLWGAEGTGVLVAAGSGYRLALDADHLDLLRFRELAEAGHTADDPARALGQLLAAARLWRGETDVEQLRGTPLVAALFEQYATLLCQAAALGRQLGEQEQVLPLLRELAERLELHEPLHAELIMAAVASGRQAEALAAYDRVRRALIEQLGVDPGPQLRYAYEAVLRQQWPPAVAPSPRPTPIRQVPAGPSDFVGRERELDRIGAALARSVPASMRVVLISGSAGVGKTALALTLAHRLRDEYPDGQLYADLRSGTSGPATPMEVLGRFLRALGVPAGRIGPDEEEASALLRSALADRRMLLVLDNARDAAQVRALLPGPGGSDALVASRRRLPDLSPWLIVDLATLSTADAVRLMDSTVGAGRVSADPESARELAAACGQLPLALRIAAGRLASRPAWTTSELAHRLRDENHRLTQLSAGDTSVLASFQLSYQDLSESVRRAFRLCALHPGDDFGVEATAELLGVDQVEADLVLGELLDANMLLQYTAERFRFHDLLGLYAARLLGEEDPADADAARNRLHSWSLRTATEAVELLNPGMVRLVASSGGGPFADQEAALRWLDAEAGALLALVEQAADGARPQLSWLLADQLRGYFLIRRHVDRWLRTAEAGLRAATAAADRAGRAAMLLSRGQAMWALGRHAQALADYRAGERLSQGSDWPAAAPYLWHNIGVVRAEQGRLDEAERGYREALRLCGDRTELAAVRALALNGLGAMYADQGQLAEAAECLRDALRINAAAGRTASVLSTRGNLGMVLRQLGQERAAEKHLTAALAGYRRRSNMHGELSTLDELSQLYAQRGDAARALSAAQQGYDLAVIVRDQRAQAALLCTLGEARRAGDDPAGALRFLRQALDMARQNGYPYFAARAQVGLAVVHLGLGAHGLARGCAAEARELATTHDFRMVEADALAALARCLAATDADEAPATVAAAVAAYRAAGAQVLGERLRDLLAAGR
ncbi:BTAD domain-containing putative transcriptional regulator [Micromonospora sp. NBC_01412]|uniref:BTAD domain-containing putative transcriptional regulator n=1 Tax=Micromonospora sp. NBC_01412 TaxID=2903590 RepID=UPI00324985BF